MKIEIYRSLVIIITIIFGGPPFPIIIVPPVIFVSPSVIMNPSVIRYWFILDRSAVIIQPFIFRRRLIMLTTSLTAGYKNKCHDDDTKQSMMGEA